MSQVSSLDTWRVQRFSLEGARPRLASRWVAVTRLSRLVYGFSLTKILVPGQSMWHLWWGESVTACIVTYWCHPEHGQWAYYILHWHEIRDVDSGHIRDGSSAGHVI